jgi:hypothetical protein
MQSNRRCIGLGSYKKGYPPRLRKYKGEKLD